MLQFRKSALIDLLKQLKFKSDSQYLRLEIFEDNAWLSRSDYDNQLSLNTECSNTFGFSHSLIIDFDRFFKLVKKSKYPTIGLEVKLNIHTVIATAGKIKAEFMLHEPVLLPEPIKGDFSLVGTLHDSRGLSKQLEKVLKFAGTNESRKNLMGVNFTSRYIQAADAFRIDRIEHNKTIHIDADKFDKACTSRGVYLALDRLQNTGKP